jgi:glycosyltransferase involved in cell wall biosynthesis
VTASPLVSVVVPAYDAEPYLADSVGSALRQTWRELEVVVVDDGSGDGTAALAARLGEADPRVRLVRQANGGLSAARNAGLLAARGEYVCFLDADDAYLPDKIARQLAFLEAFPRCDLVYSDHYVGDAQLTPLTLDTKSPPPIPMEKLLAYRNWFAPLAPLLRAAFRERIGLFDPDLPCSEDWDYWIRASRCGTFAYLPGPVGVYRTHPGQMHHDWGRMRRYQKRVVAKHFAPGSSEWHVAQAALAWADAKRQWFDGHSARSAVQLLRFGWYARSRRTVANVVQMPLS